MYRKSDCVNEITVEEITGSEVGVQAYHILYNSTVGSGVNVNLRELFVTTTLITEAVLLYRISATIKCFTADNINEVYEAPRMIIYYSNRKILLHH